MILQMPLLFYYLLSCLSLLVCSFAANSDDEVSSSSSSILDSYHATTTVKSRLAETTIAMVFVNPNEYCSDIHSMTLQLPRNARLTNLIMDLSDGCQLNSTVKVLETAIDDFNDASSQGKAAALLTASWDMTNYNLQISIPPNGTTNVELTYSELLFQKLGQVHFQVPLYPGGGGIPINRLQMDIIVEESNTGIFAFNPGNLLLLDGDGHDDDTALIDTTFVVGQTFASAHYETSQIPATAEDDSTLPTLLQASFKPGPLPESGLFLSDGNCFTHLFNPTTFLASAGSMARKIVFVIDVSGSMAGQKLDDAKASFVAMIDTLDDRDTLIVQSFSDEGTESLWGPATATSSNKNQAKDFVARLETIGGTNLNQAFVDGINNVYDAPSEVAPILVILTDGQGNIGPRDTARNVLSANEGRKVKIFALAFGYDADMDLLLGIAIQNGGRAVRIYEGFGDAVSQMEQFYLQELGTIMLSDVDVSYNFIGDGDGEGVIVAGLLSDSTVPQFPVLALGSEIVVRGKMDSSSSLSIPANAMLTSTVTAHSAVGAQQWLNEYPIIHNGTVDAVIMNSDCRSSFAQARIAELLEYRDAERALGEDLFGGDGSSGTTSTTRSTTSSDFEEQARQIAVDAHLVWPGLTALVTVENIACQQNTYEVCYSSGDGAEGNSNNDIESEWFDAGTVQSSSRRSGGSGTYSYGMMITSLCSSLLATTLLMATSYLWD